MEWKELRSGAKKVSKSGRKSYSTKSSLNFPKLGKIFDKISGKNLSKSEQFLTAFYKIKIHSKK